MSDSARIFKEVQLAIARAEHNTLAGVEDMCFSSAMRKRHAPLLRRIAKWKAGLRGQMRGLQRLIERSDGDSRP